MKISILAPKKPLIQFQMSKNPGHDALQVDMRWFEGAAVAAPYGDEVRRLGWSRYLVLGGGLLASLPARGST